MSLESVKSVVKELGYQNNIQALFISALFSLILYKLVLSLWL
jgi:hypothetical protein